MSKLNHLAVTGALLLGLAGCSKQATTNQDTANEARMEKLEREIGKIRRELAINTAYRQSLTIPCDEESIRRIGETRARLLPILPAIQDDVETDCKTRSDCPNKPAFWPQLAQTVKNAYVFCPTERPAGDDKVEAAVVYNKDGEYPGSYALFGVHYRGACTLAESMVHEATHLASGEVHKSKDQDDWTYLVGEKAARQCEKSFNK